jgi:Family of unknown function (DUF5941)
MSAAAVTPTPAGAEHARLLGSYRDDGPLATALGRGIGLVGTPPAIALLLIATLPLLAAIATAGAGASHALVAAVVAWAVAVGGLSSGRPLTDSLRWAVPPTLRALEYSGLMWIAAVAGASTLPAVFALLCAVAYHQYDTVYGRRHRGVAPLRWAQALAGGWDGRLLAACALLLLGALPAGYFVGAALLGCLFVGVTVAEWRRAGRTPAPQLDDAAYDALEEDEAV